MDIGQGTMRFLIAIQEVEKRLVNVGNGAEKYPNLGPLEVGIDITTSCNLNCLPCYSHSPLLDRPFWWDTRLSSNHGAKLDCEEADPASVGNKAREFGFLEFTRLVDDLRDLQTVLITISGEGEPLTHRHLLAMVRYAKLNGLQCGIISNGTLIDRQLAESLVEAQLDYLNISIMAGSPEVYAALHPGHKEWFFRVVENIRLISKAKKSLRSDKPRVSLNNVICNKNVCDIRRMVILCHLTDAQEIHLQFLGTHGGTQSLLLCQTELELLQQELHQALDIAKNYGISTNIAEFSLVSRHLHGEGKECTRDIYTRIHCVIGLLFSETLVNGYVLPCCSCYRPLGNVRKATFSEIWRSKEYEAFRESAYKMASTGKPIPHCQCHECGHYEMNLMADRIIKQLVANKKEA